MNSSARPCRACGKRALLIDWGIRVGPGVYRDIALCADCSWPIERALSRGARTGIIAVDPAKLKKTPNLKLQTQKRKKRPTPKGGPSG